MEVSLIFRQEKEKREPRRLRLAAAGQGRARSRVADYEERAPGHARDRQDDAEIVARQTANFNRAEGLTVFEDILQANPEIDGVFAHNDEMILGAVQAAKAAGRAKDIVFVGFDAVDDAVNAVKAGNLAATVAQQPAVIGELGVKTAVDHLNGKSVPKNIPVPLSLVTK